MSDDSQIEARTLRETGEPCLDAIAKLEKI